MTSISATNHSVRQSSEKPLNNAGASPTYSILRLVFIMVHINPN
uniref:Uncharacterized protein n=1 Tax=Rhizophora mucronata TaxID=61149 RepID=A0A2P2NRW7_RHIMU